MVFKNGVKNIQAAVYNGTRTVFEIYLKGVRGYQPTFGVNSFFCLTLESNFFQGHVKTGVWNEKRWLLAWDSPFAIFLSVSKVPQIKSCSGLFLWNRISELGWFGPIRHFRVHKFPAFLLSGSVNFQFLKLNQKKNKKIAFIQSHHLHL